MPKQILIEPEVGRNQSKGLKSITLGSRNPRLHSNEILIALAITAMQNPVTQTVL